MDTISARTNVRAEILAEQKFEADGLGNVSLTSVSQVADGEKSGEVSGSGNSGERFDESELEVLNVAGDVGACLDPSEVLGSVGAAVAEDGGQSGSEENVPLRPR